jgi:hypothetical protein
MDLSVFHGRFHNGETGAPACDPAMLLKIVPCSAKGPYRTGQRGGTPAGAVTSPARDTIPPHAHTLCSSDRLPSGGPVVPGQLGPRERRSAPAVGRLPQDLGARPLVIVKPATVIGWHRKGVQRFWRRKSRSQPLGRPRIAREHIAFIQRISRDHPEWGEDRIAEELVAKFGVEHSPSTIRRYMAPRNGSPRGDQTWRTFVRNHAKEIWACDFLTQYTALFAVVYVFVIMEIDSRRIAHVNVTTNPTLLWVKRKRSAMGAFPSSPA